MTLSLILRAIGKSHWRLPGIDFLLVTADVNVSNCRYKQNLDINGLCSADQNKYEHGIHKALKVLLNYYFNYGLSVVTFTVQEIHFLSLPVTIFKIEPKVKAILLLSLLNYIKRTSQTATKSTLCLTLREWLVRKQTDTAVLNIELLSIFKKYFVILTIKRLRYKWFLAFAKCQKHFGQFFFREKIKRIRIQGWAIIIPQHTIQTLLLLYERFMIWIDLRFSKCLSLINRWYSSKNHVFHFFFWFNKEALLYNLWWLNISNSTNHFLRAKHFILFLWCKHA